jgi:histidinol phosphatase-like PHP family hydrolase
MLNIREDYHVHTNFNDHSPSNLSVALTEHVRKTSEWIPKYLEEIDKAKSSGTALRMIPGFEAKILTNGTLDFPEEYADHFLVASLHTKYGAKDKWYNPLKMAIENTRPNSLGHLAPEESLT